MRRHTEDIPPPTWTHDLAATLDPARRTPLYDQLAHAIVQAIEAGDLTPGTMLPPEPEFATQLGVSRQTVNQALTWLAQRGIVTRRRGVGTVVAEPFIEQRLGELYSFVRTLSEQGRIVTTRLLGYRITVDETASLLLAGRRDALVFEVTRLRIVDGDPFAVETSYLPLECGETLPVDRLSTDVLYDLLHELCGIAVTHAEETLRPVTIEQPDAALLGVQVGDAVFRVERTSYAGAQPIELRSSLIRGDRFRFRAYLEATGATRRVSD
jgi:GntR family transcriptional regulator